MRVHCNLSVAYGTIPKISIITCTYNSEKTSVRLDPVEEQEYGT